MRSTLGLFLVATAIVMRPAPAESADFFPYPVEKRTLPNGLDVLVIETPEFADVASFNVLILAGSRNEIEKGKSGLAHLFEHIAFRHKFEDPVSSYRYRMEKMGAFDNAWTWFDVTYYHPVTFSDDLEDLIDVQAERFVAMDFSEKIYRTEGGAVLGEYRRAASNPSLRMEEVLSDLAYGPEHGYGHTTIGYIEDIRNMPETYAAGKAFYETYYRPNNAAVVVAGDVGAERVFPLIERHFGGWERREIPELPDPAPLDGPVRKHVDWESAVAPRITYAYRVMPFRPGTVESAVLTVLPELIAGETSPLYQKLRYEKKLATDMFTERRSAQGFDSRTLETSLRLDKAKFDDQGKPLFDEVIRELDSGFDELGRFSERAGAEEKLRAIQSKFRYDLLASLNSPQNIASTLAWYYRFDRDPAVLDTLVDSVDRLKAEDIDQFAREYFVEANRVIVTLSSRGAP